MTHSHRRSTARFAWFRMDVPKRHRAVTQLRDSVAGYARAEYDFVDKLKISGGVRYSHDKVRVRNYLAFNGTIQDPTLIPTIDIPERARSTMPRRLREASTIRRCPTC